MVESRTDALLGLGNGRPSPRIAVKALHGHGIRSCGNHRKLPRFVTQFHICSLGHRCELVKKLPQKQALPGSAGMAELADAADSKSAGTWYLGGSTPPPGTMQFNNLRVSADSSGAGRCRVCNRFVTKRF